MFLINGYKKDSLTANDRAIQFGDGIFTTARVIDGHIYLFDAHLHRLQIACQKLFIQFTQWDILRDEMLSLSVGVKYGVLKVIISRGRSTRSGYSIDNCFYPNRILFILPYPRHYDIWRNSGIKLNLSPVRLGCNTMLAGIKHLNRLEQVLVHAYLDRSDADEALVLDSTGVITECCTSNLFWRKDDKVFTPRLDRAGVDGVMRQFCISKLVNSQFFITEITTDLKALDTADEILVCNALMPILPVKTYESKQFQSRELYQFLSPLCEKIE